MSTAAEADVVGPAVAAEDPDGLLAEILGVLQDLARERAGLAGAAFHDAVLESGLVSFGSLVVGLAVVHRVEPLLSGGLEVGVGVADSEELLREVGQTHADGLLAKIHAEAVLGVVFKEGVGPCGAAAFLVGAVRRDGARAAPDGRAAGGV